MDVAAAGGAFAEMHHGHVPLASPFQDHRHPAGHGAGVAEVRNDGNHASRHVAEVQGIVAPASRAVRAAHPVGEDFLQREAAYDIRGKVAMAGKHHVPLIELDGRTHRNRLLPPAHVDSADDFPLAVEHPLDALLGRARELEVVEHPTERIGIGELSDPVIARFCHWAHREKSLTYRCPHDMS